MCPTESPEPGQRGAVIVDDGGFGGLLAALIPSWLVLMCPIRTALVAGNQPWSTPCLTPFSEHPLSGRDRPSFVSPPSTMAASLMTGR